MFKHNLLQNYLVTAIRNIRKNQLFSLINVFGLALSMSIGLLIITMVTELRGYDDFHEDGERIYRINNTYQYLDEDPELYASTSALAGKRIQEEVAGLEGATLIYRHFSNDFGSSERMLPLSGYFASEEFLSLLSFNVLEGDPTTALLEPYSIVLTAKAADKLFGKEEDLVGQILLTPEEKQYTVTAIVEDPPFNSHLQFEVLGSFSTKEDIEKDNDGFLSWRNMWMYHVYLKVEEGIDKETIEASLARISAEENAKMEHRKIQLGLQPLQSITPGLDISNEIGKTTPREIPIMLSVFALIVIASSCFNYTNLSIARSVKRAKEVGVRKVVGSSTVQILWQFLVESIVVAFVALFLAIGLFYLIKEPFLGLSEYLAEQLTLQLTWPLIGQFILFTLITGIIAGGLPAIVYSKIAPSSAFRSNLSLSGYKGVALRKVLIVVQFALSVGFIFAAIIEYRQYKFATNFDLGYSTSSVLIVELQDNDIDAVKGAFAAIPEVEMQSASLMMTSVGSYWAETVKYKDPLDSASVYFNGVDEHYLKLYENKLIAGQNFAPLKNDSASLQIIPNEQFLKRFELGSPEEALGEIVKFDDKEARIVGVVKDFHYGSVDRKIEPFLFTYENDDFYKISLKLTKAANLVAAREKVESAWKKIDELHPIEAMFYDEHLERRYEGHSIMVKVVGSLAFLAIVIATMGLLGMVMFTAETRLKEIGIRKVLGASEQSLIYLLGKGFLVLLFIASLIAVPLTFLLFNEVVLSSIANRVTIGVIDSLIGPLLIMLIGLLTVLGITFQAARTNPATILRNE